MTTARHPIHLDRRSVIALIAACVPAATAFARGLARLEVRDVVRRLVEARDGLPADLSRSDLSGLNLSELDFKGADLSHSNLFGADLTDSNLDGANLSHAVLDRATLVRARFSNAVLRDASIRRPSIFSDLHFDKGDLPVFRRCDLSRVTLTARLDGADFSGANLTEARFVVWAERNLGGPPISGLAGCDFSGAILAALDARGVSFAYSVLRDADLSGADLRGADLSYADLEGADLSGALLDGAETYGAKGLGRNAR